MINYEDLYWRLKVLYTPSCWVRSNPTCEYTSEWWLKRFKEGIVVKDLGEHVCYVKGECIWIANHPYASMSVEDLTGRDLPARWIALKARHEVIKAWVKQREDEYLVKGLSKTNKRGHKGHER